jgi:hypothetical protein
MERTLIALMQSSSRDRPDVDELEVDVERGAAAVSVGCDMETFAPVVKIARMADYRICGSIIYKLAHTLVRCSASHSAASRTSLGTRL